MPLADLRIGLALGGGGSRGAFTVGAIEGLVELTGIKDFPVVAGTSTGALVATLVCNRQFGDLRHFYTEVETGNIVNPNHPVLANLFGNTAAVAAAALFGNQSVFDASALAELVEKFADMDLAKERSDVCHLILSTVSLQTGQMVLFSNRQHGSATLRKALLASASEPVFMPPVEIAARGRKDQYVDGGVREILPIVPIFEAKEPLDAIIAISTNPLETNVHELRFGSLIDIMGRTIELFVDEVQSNDFEGARRVNALLKIVENARACLDEPELFSGIDPDIVSWLETRRSVPILHLGPKEYIDISSLDFSKPKMTALMTEGRKRAVELLRPFLKKLAS